MSRRFLLLAVLGWLIAPVAVRADAFDQYINTILEKVDKADGAKEIKQLTPEMILDNNRVIPDTTSAMIVVQTNEGRLAKVLVQAARKRLNDEKKTQVDILLIERYATYKAGTERAVTVQGQNVYLFDGFQFSLDLGQVVPPTLTPDLRFVAREKDEKSEIYLETVGNAKMWLLTKPLPEAAPPKKGEKFVIGDVFEPKYFGGKFKLYDDGRRSGTLELEVDDEGNVGGHFFSDKDGERYKVTGKVLQPKHTIQFAVKFPRTEQVFRGWMFTGTGLAITGWSKLQDREAGFYATRVED
jgi:hypothetical protein